ncbi:DedA family protein [bacterium]|nr:DedA family protein [bacterium]
MNFIDIILHLDTHLNEWIALFGPGIYLILFLIVFCETGLVVTPFLPGDSLLFALGALSATPDSILSPYSLAPLLILAALCGDIVNYTIGRWSGERLKRSRFIKKEYLEKTEHFYAKYGGKTIILARFMPIVRTFAPFVAGMGHMHFAKYFFFCVVGALAWVLSFLILGYHFGNMTAIKENFHIVIVAIIIISMLPGVIEFIKAKRKSV